VTRNELVERLHDKIGEMMYLVEQNLPIKGLCEEDCQRLYLINRLYALEHAVNGIEPDDIMNPDE
jgi:hypothetical protein